MNVKRLTTAHATGADSGIFELGAGNYGIKVWWLCDVKSHTTSFEVTEIFAWAIILQRHLLRNTFMEFNYSRQVKEE